MKTNENDPTKDKTSDSSKGNKENYGKPSSKSTKVDANGKKYNTGRWSEEEHRKFMEAIELFGKDWKKVQQHVGTRTSAQSRSHAQKVLAKPNAAKSSSSDHTPKQGNNGQNDFEKCISQNTVQKNTTSPHNIGTQLETPSIIEYHHFADSNPPGRARLHSSKEDAPPVFEQNAKRKCTFDVSACQNEEENLMVENDEVSLQLLKKLTTPKQLTKSKSMRYPDVDNFGLRLDFNSDIDSMEGDELDKRSACDFKPLNEFVCDVIEDMYL